MSKQIDSTRALVAMKAEMDDIWSRNFWTWLCQQVMTVDESADTAITGTKVLPWPQEQYLREASEVLCGEQVLGIPKSRRMMISWLVAAFFTWSARYHDNGALFWMSQSERKAAFQVDKRCYFIETHLKHGIFEKQVKTIRTTDSLIGSMTYDNGSYIWAIPEGGHVLRNYTATKVMCDEIEFQQQAPETIRSLMPLIENGCQAIIVSSSNGPSGVLAEICAEIGFRSWYDVGMLKRQKIA